MAHDGGVASGSDGPARGCALRRARPALALLAALGALGSTCSDPTHYQVEMRLRDGMLERRVSREAVEQPSERDDARWAVLEQVYGAAAPDRVFEKRFSAVPADLGGAGGWLRRSNPLGSVFSYRERLQGEDDLALLPERLQAGVEQLRVLAGGWMEDELGAQHPAAAPLDRFLRDRLIPDLRTVALYRWLVSSGLIGESEAEQRVAQFLFERGYFGLEDLAASGELRWSVLARRALERDGVAVDEALVRDLEAIAPGGDPEKSFLRHVSRSEGFRAWLAGHPESAQDADDTALPPDALADFASGVKSPGAERVDQSIGIYLESGFAEAIQLVAQLFLAEAFEDDDRVSASFALPEAPLATNGRWNPKLQRIEWPALRLREGSGLPALIYASWAEPDREYQRARFGKVLLSGNALAEYSDWYDRQLSAEQRRTWDEFLAELRPGANLCAQLEGFGFGDDPDERDERGKRIPGRADPAIRLLVQALGPGSAAVPAAHPQ